MGTRARPSKTGREGTASRAGLIPLPPLSLFPSLLPSSFLCFPLPHLGLLVLGERSRAGRPKSAFPTPLDPSSISSSRDTPSCAITPFNRKATVVSVSDKLVRKATHAKQSSPLAAPLVQSRPCVCLASACLCLPACLSSDAPAPPPGSPPPSAPRADGPDQVRPSPRLPSCALPLSADPTSPAEEYSHHSYLTPRPSSTVHGRRSSGGSGRARGAASLLRPRPPTQPLLFS